MTIYEALKLLNLNYNYDEESLKKAYRKEIMMYHPDKHSGRDKIICEAKTKRLNEAKELLTKKIKSRNKNEGYTTTYSKVQYEEYSDDEELLELKVQYMKELKRELEYLQEVDSKDKIFMYWKDKFLKLIYDSYLSISSQSNIISIKVNYDYYRENYFELLCAYLYAHWNNSRVMDFVNGKLNIDENDGIKEVRTKMIMSINNLLNVELDEFKMLDDYIDIEPLLLSIRDDFAYVCLYGYANIDRIRKDFKDRVVLEIKKYNDRKAKIDNLIKCYGYPNMLVVELHNNILYEEKFISLYNDKVDTKTKVRVKIKSLFSK